MVEETRNQVAVKRGPVVYCAESFDLPKGKKIFDIAIPVQTNFSPRMINIDNSEIMSLETEAKVISKSGWENVLYREVSKEPSESVKIRLIPYYAWGNRGHNDMTVWLPVSR